MYQFARNQRGGQLGSLSALTVQYMLKIKTQTEIGLLLPIFREKPDLSAVHDPELWEIIQRCAGRHGMAPLLAYAVQSHVHAEERAWCARTLAQSWASYQRSLRGLEFVAATLDRRGIQLLALKGPVLAARSYQPPFLRMPSGDLDFAVRACDIDEACAALSEVGYTLESPLETARAFSHHVVMLHPARVALELHFRMSHGPFGLPVDPFIEQAVRYRLQNGTEVLILEGAAEVFHLALHAVCGRFRPFFHLYELRRICIARGPATVRQAAAMAAECNMAGVFALIDAAFQSCWGERFLSADVLMPQTWLQWRINEKLYQACLQWSESASAHSLRSRLQGRWLDLQTTDRPSDALRRIEMLTRFAWFQLRGRVW